MVPGSNARESWANVNLQMLMFCYTRSATDLNSKPPSGGFFISGARMEGNKEIVEALNGLRDDMSQRHSENITQMAVTDRKVEEVIRRVDDLHDAFPGGDWDGHRRYHEAVIKKLEAREKFYQDLRVELAKKGVWALAVMLGLALWAFFKSKVNS
ncbi:hypothetical protein [Paraburkholderia xenovorans]|uniref:hypothetical protein n=1 Tax=Paraburkholderia xenovorans TaxID=36873 RepID=UPI0015C52C24|nr:hypothetical protein [Paraburkholderia xenovorans]NPT39672.1 hypothetical protein [Paraburkholderia xenovorans]